MRYFRHIATLPVTSLIAEIAEHEPLWREITLRQDFPGSAHHDTETIFLRAPIPEKGGTVYDWLRARDTTAMHQLPSMTKLLRQLRLDYWLGRMMLVRLKPFGVIDPHVDEGSYARAHDRYHLVLTSPPECQFICGDELVHMAPGELWWFNHQILHWVANGPTPRVHLIIDMKRAIVSEP